MNDSIINIIKKLKRIRVESYNKPLFAKNDYIELHIDFNGKIKFALKSALKYVPIEVMQKLADFMVEYSVDCKVSYDVKSGKIKFTFIGI